MTAVLLPSENTGCDKHPSGLVLALIRVYSEKRSRAEVIRVQTGAFRVGTASTVRKKLCRFIFSRLFLSLPELHRRYQSSTADTLL